MKSNIQESILYLNKQKDNELYNNINIKINQSRNLTSDRIIESEFFSITYQENNIGPNVNLKFPKNLEYSKSEKEFFKNKINNTKKTEICKNWELFGDCYFKNNCSFAHGEYDLRNKLTRIYDKNKKFKTKPCRSFIDKSYCPFGNRCQYTHVVSQSRLIKYKALNLKFANGIMIEALKEENGIIEFDKLIANFNLNTNFKM